MKTSRKSWAQVIVLALGAGLAAGVFGVAHELLRRPLPLTNVEDLVVIRGAAEPPAGSEVTDWFAVPSLRAMASVALSRQAVRVDQTGATADVAEASANVLDVLGARLQQGRGPSASAEAWAVVSPGFWRGQLGGRPLGNATLAIGALSYPVLGVLSDEFRWVQSVDLWVGRPAGRPEQLAREGGGARRRALSDNELIGLLSAGATPTRARLEITERQRQLERTLGLPQPSDVTVDRIQDLLTRGIRQPLSRFQWVTALLLGMCVFSHFAFAALDALSRRLEWATRYAVGASPTALALHLVRGAGLRGGVAGLLAAGVALATARVVSAILPVEFAILGSPRTPLTVAVTGLVLGVGFGLLSVAASAFLLRPATHLAALRAEAVAGPSRRRGWRHLLLIPATGVATTLAGLAWMEFVGVRGAEQGRLRPQSVWAAEIAAGPQDDDLCALEERLLRANRGRAGVELAVLDRLPSIGSTRWLWVGPESDAGRMALATAAAGSFPELLDLPVTRGSVADLRNLRPGTVVINEALAATVAPGSSSLGSSLVVGGRPAVVVGVVADRKMGAGAAAEPQVFLPLSTTCADRERGALLLRARGAESLADLRVFLASNPTLPSFEDFHALATLPNPIGAARRAWLRLASWGAGVGLTIALISAQAILLGEMAAARRENSIRLMLGATLGSIRLRTIRSLLIPSAVGTCIGALLLRLLEALGHGRTSTSQAIAFGAALVCVLLATSAWATVLGMKGEISDLTRSSS
ncbi:MAG: ABC transporter permease [Vicinamibacteria bacterium]|nr:ABC transporter permease [Vicinamibacteria bacterium]